MAKEVAEKVSARRRWLGAPNPAAPLTPNLTLTLTLTTDPNPNPTPNPIQVSARKRWRALGVAVYSPPASCSEEPPYESTG